MRMGPKLRPPASEHRLQKRSSHEYRTDDERDGEALDCTIWSCHVLSSDGTLDVEGYCIYEARRLPDTRCMVV